VDGVHRLRMDPVTVDRLVAVALTVWLELETWLTSSADHHRLASSLFYLPMTASVALRRRYPAVVGILGAALALIGHDVWNTMLISSAIAFFCDLYALSVWTPTRIFVPAAAGQFVLSFVPHPAKSTVPFVVAETVIMVLVRWVVRNHERRASLAERERDVVAREAVVEERARIARELHDVIAHHVSMIVLQAGAERRATGGETAEVLGTIERAGRDALTETRRLLGMLREDTHDPLSPQPGLSDLPLLVSQVEEAGLSVDLSIDGDRRPLPVGLELSAYRIVQEALTNVLKHAGGARAHVSVSYGEDELELLVLDDGTGPHAAETGGHGLVGMRERVSLYGGQFEATRNAGGGFLVRALLPIR
jgi:signal transduction histidine kinase